MNTKSIFMLFTMILLSGPILSALAENQTHMDNTQFYTENESDFYQDVQPVNQTQAKRCKNNFQCPALFVCVRERCVYAQGMDNSCHWDFECSVTHQCKDRQCKPKW